MVITLWLHTPIITSRCFLNYFKMSSSSRVLFANLTLHSIKTFSSPLRYSKTLSHTSSLLNSWLPLLLLLSSLLNCFFHVWYYYLWKQRLIYYCLLHHLFCPRFWSVVIWLSRYSFVICGSEESKKGNFGIAKITFNHIFMLASPLKKQANSSPFR